MKYDIKEFEDVFNQEFLDYMQNADFTKSNVQLIMNRVSEYEIKNQLKFVNFFANQYIIFERII